MAKASNTFAMAEGPFSGLDLSMDPANLSPGALQVADNAVIDGGDVYTRPGYRGQLASALGAGIYAPTPFISSGSSNALFVSGGKLYKWAYGATSATELLEGGLSLSLTSASAQTAAGNNLAYVVDGTGSLHRVDLTSSVAITSLSTPTAPSALTLTGRTLDGTSTASDWYDARSGSGIAHGWIACDSTKTGNLLSNNGFESALGATNWTAGGPTPGAQDATYFRSGSKGAALAAAGDSVSQKLTASSATVPTMTVGGITNFSGAPQKVRVYRLEFWMHSEDTSGASTVEAQVVAYAGGAVIGSVSYSAAQYKQASATKFLPHTFIASFAELDTDPDDIEVILSAGYSNTAAVYVDDVDLRAVTYQLIPTLATAGDQIEAQTYTSVASSSGGRAPGTPAPDDAAAGYCHKQYIFRTFSTAQDWSSYPSLSARVTFPEKVLQANPDITLRIGLATASSAISYSPPGEWSADGKSLVWNLQGINATQRASVKYLIVEVVGNQEGGVGSGQALFRLGPVLSPGGLTVGAPVWYRIVEMDNSGDSSLLDVPESDTSKPSPQIIPASDAAMCSLTIPARTNSSSTHFALYRYGGSLIEPERGKYPLGFLVGIFSWSQSTFDFGSGPAAGSSPYYRAPANPYLKWTLTSANNGGTLVDNTPDGWLSNGQIAFEGREPATGVSAPKDVEIWDGRLWLLSGSADLYASWRLNSDRRAGLYFSRVTLPTAQDPHAAIRGWWARLALDSGDAVQCIHPMNDRLAVLTTQGVWMVSRAEFGYRADRVPGVPGVVGPRAACVCRGALYWISPDGIWAMGGGKAERISPKVELYLPPLSDLTASALAASSAFHWWRYLFFTIPGSTSDTYPTVALVLDYEDGTWTRWTGATWNGGVALQSGGSLGRLIAAGRDGQIYAIGSDEGDKALSGSSATAVALSARTRDARFSRRMLPDELYYDCKTGGTGTATLTVKGDTSGADSAETQSLTSGDNGAWLRPSRGAYGRRLSMQFDISSTTRTRLRRLLLNASEGTE